MFGPLAVSGHIHHVLGYLASCVKPSVKNLGDLFDSVLTLDKQVNAAVNRMFITYKHPKCSY